MFNPKVHRAPLTVQNGDGASRLSGGFTPKTCRGVFESGKAHLLGETSEISVKPTQKNPENHVLCDIF